MRNFTELIISELKKNGPRPVNPQVIISNLHIKKRETAFFKMDLDKLISTGKVSQTPKGIVMSKSKPGVEATVIRIHEKYGFVKPTQGDKDIFIPGRYLKGAMPGDKVLVKVNAKTGELEDGEVIEILERAPYVFSGTIKKTPKSCTILPDKDVRFEIDVKKADWSFANDGDKVLAEIFSYGERHFDHKATIKKVFGESESAKVCCEAILESNNISRIFPPAVIEQAEDISLKGIYPKEIETRVDLRAENIFTIDGADSKDLDDAVSIAKVEEGWELGVHIADVSYYVFHDCPLDREAYKRGTSVYFADSVVPMLPKELSNGICSLNPNEDRLTFSAIIKLDQNADMKSYAFKKTVIRSRVKGVYSEINSIMDKSATSEIMEKYNGQLHEIKLMKELSDVLNAKRMGRGAVNLESVESKIVLDENGKAIGIVPRERGDSEKIIEEFMLVANQAAAQFGEKREIPFVYRVHEPPSGEKISNLKEVLQALGINTAKITSDVQSSVLSEILKEVEGTKYSKLINNTILRSMSKAKYTPDNVGHYGLVLEDYAHFTSPIRRYPDLVIHRTMSAILTGMRRDNIEKRYREFVGQAAIRSSMTEIAAMTVERDCEDCYKAEYIRAYIGEEFDGIVSGVAAHGVYVELPNTVEGMCKPQTIPNTDFAYDDKMQYKDYITGKTIRVGDTLRIKVLSSDISAGNIDFEIVKFYD